jgi:hypothetical protein
MRVMTHMHRRLAAGATPAEGLADAVASEPTGFEYYGVG